MPQLSSYYLSSIANDCVIIGELASMTALPQYSIRCLYLIDSISILDIYIILVLL